MNAPLDPGLAQELLTFTLNGRAIEAHPGETIIQAADRLGVAIPRLCYKPGYRPDGNCRACMFCASADAGARTTNVDRAENRVGLVRWITAVLSPQN